MFCFGVRTSTGSKASTAWCTLTIYGIILRNGNDCETRTGYRKLGHFEETCLLKYVEVADGICVDPRRLDRIITNLCPTTTTTFHKWHDVFHHGVTANPGTVDHLRGFIFLRFMHFITQKWAMSWWRHLSVSTCTPTQSTMY